MKITTKKQADAAVRALEKYLDAEAAKPRKNIPPNEWATPTEKLARDYAEKLLVAANCDGMHGCLLCQS